LRFPRPLVAFLHWFDADIQAGSLSFDHNGVDWIRIIPFIAVHATCLGLIWVGWSRTALLVTALLYGTRMFAITAFYHRYFSHRVFQTNRFWQFVFALIGNAAVQRGPLWWAAQHRKHHRHADGPGDPHSPVQHGLLWSHMGWFTTRGSFTTDFSLVPDLARFPELRLLDRFSIFIPVALAVGLFFLGCGLRHLGVDTSGAQLLIWGFFVSTVLLFHGTCTINSLAHRFGSRSYRTADNSRNSLLLALITLGEGWHNNHHRFPASCRLGHRWWEIDIAYLLLKLMAKMGIVWDLKVPEPETIRDSLLA
jgi:stearoyl-CoA desaturase (delta-9 desaturase)